MRVPSARVRVNGRMMTTTTTVAVAVHPHQTPVECGIVLRSPHGSHRHPHEAAAAPGLGPSAMRRRRYLVQATMTTMHMHHRGSVYVMA